MPFSNATAANSGNNNNNRASPPVKILATAMPSLSTSPTHSQQLPRLQQQQQQQHGGAQFTASVLGGAQSFSLVSNDSMMVAAAAAAALHDLRPYNTAALASGHTVDIATPLSHHGGATHGVAQRIMAGGGSGSSAGHHQQRASLSTSSSGSAIYAPHRGGVSSSSNITTPLRGNTLAVLPTDVRMSLSGLQFTMQSRAAEVHEQLHGMAQLLETLMATADIQGHSHNSDDGTPSAAQPLQQASTLLPVPSKTAALQSSTVSPVVTGSPMVPHQPANPPQQQSTGGVEGVVEGARPASPRGRRLLSISSPIVSAALQLQPPPPVQQHDGGDVGTVTATPLRPPSAVPPLAEDMAAISFPLQQPPSQVASTNVATVNSHQLAPPQSQRHPHLTLRSPHHSLHSDAYNVSATANKALLAHLQMQLLDFVNAETAYQVTVQNAIKAHERVLVNSCAATHGNGLAAPGGGATGMTIVSTVGSSSSPASPLLLQSPPAGAAAAAAAVVTGHLHKAAAGSASSASAASFCSTHDDPKQQRPPTLTTFAPVQQQQQQLQPPHGALPRRIASFVSTSDRSTKSSTTTSQANGTDQISTGDDDKSETEPRHHLEVGDGGVADEENTDVVAGDLADVVAEGASLTLPHQYRHNSNSSQHGTVVPPPPPLVSFQQQHANQAFFTSNQYNEGSIELGFIPDEEMFPASLQPSMAAGGGVVGGGDVASQGVGGPIGLFEALDHLRGTNSRAAVQLGSFRRKRSNAGPSYTHVTPKHHHPPYHRPQQLNHNGGVVPVMELVGDDEETMDYEQSIEVSSPVAAVGGGGGEDYLRHTASGRAAQVQSAVSVFSDHQPPVFEHPVPASSGGQFWQQQQQQRRGGGAGGRHRRGSPSNLVGAGHKRSSSKEDITFPLYVYANIETAKKHDDSEEHQHLGADEGGSASITTPVASPHAVVAAGSRASVEEGESTPARRKQQLTLACGDFASPPAGAIHVAETPPPASPLVEVAPRQIATATSPSPHPPPLHSQDVGGNGNAHRQHQPAQQTAAWKHQLSVQPVATSLSIQRSASLSTDLTSNPGVGPLGAFHLARNPFGSTASTGSLGSTANGMIASASVPDPNGGEREEQSHPSGSFESAAFLAVALMGSDANNNSPLAAQPQAGATAVAGVPRVTVEDDPVTSVTEQRRSTQAPTLGVGNDTPRFSVVSALRQRSDVEEEDDEDGLIGPLMPHSSSSGILLSAPRGGGGVLDSFGNPLPFDDRACGSGMTARPFSASTEGSTDGSRGSDKGGQPALVEVPSQELDAVVGGGDARGSSVGVAPLPPHQPPSSRSPHRKSDHHPPPARQQSLMHTASGGVFVEVGRGGSSAHQSDACDEQLIR